jgi:GWxTD domain-containing protein
MLITRSGFILFLLSAIAIPGMPQEKSGSISKQTKQQADQQDPLQRPLSEKEQKKRAAQKMKTDSPYRNWAKQEVPWIISDEEREAFARLSNDDEREKFIELFWEHRDPTPETVENEYKDEYYRRVLYANEHFSAGTPGSLTDRGHIYIAWGPPDEIESHASGGIYNRESNEGGGTTTTYPFERWRYRHMDDIGENVVLEFVDACMCNQYRLSIDPEEKNVLRNVPGGDGTRNAGVNRDNTFDKLMQQVKVMSAPKVNLNPLSTLVGTTVRTNVLPFDVHWDFVRATSDTVLVPVTIQLHNKDLTFVNKDGVQRGTVNIYGRLTTITGKIVQTFEDTVLLDVPADLLPRTLENVSLYWKALPLPPKMYRLDVVVKDVNGEKVGVFGKSLNVREFNEEKLASSSLILADVMESAPRATVGSGNFVIGDTKVRPRVEGSDGTPAKFKRNERLNLWMQVYNLGLDPKSKRSAATLEYSIVNQQTGKNVLDETETTAQMVNPGEQLTLEKRLALSSLTAGEYRVTVKVSDGVSKQVIEPSARFVVE